MDQAHSGEKVMPKASGRLLLITVFLFLVDNAALVLTPCAWLFLLSAPPTPDFSTAIEEKLFERRGIDLTTFTSRPHRGDAGGSAQGSRFGNFERRNSDARLSSRSKNPVIVGTQLDKFYLLAPIPGPEN